MELTSKSKRSRSKRNNSSKTDDKDSAIAYVKIDELVEERPRHAAYLQRFSGVRHLHSRETLGQREIKFVKRHQLLMCVLQREYKSGARRVVFARSKSWKCVTGVDGENECARSVPATASRMREIPEATSSSREDSTREAREDSALAMTGSICDMERRRERSVAGTGSK
jgi:hypothetical protein